MLNLNKTEKNISYGWLLDLAIIFIIVLILFAVAYFIFEKKYEGKIYPGVSLGGINIGGEKPEAVKNELNKKINQLNQNGVSFYYEKDQTVIMPIISSLESDLAYEVIEFDAEAGVKAAYEYGRSNNFFNNLQNKIKALTFRKGFVAPIKINEERIKNILKNNFDQGNFPAEDAKLVFKKENLLGGMENLRFGVEEEKTGKIVTYDKGINKLKNQLAVFDYSPIELATITDYPKILKKDALNVENKALKILDLSPLVLSYENNEWNIEKNALAEWLALKINPDYENNNGTEKIIVGLNNKIVEEYLQNEAALKINKTPVEAKFEIKDGKVAEFQAGQDGIELKIAASAAKIESELTRENKNEAQLIVEIAKHNNSIGDVNDMGIKEIIGIGESNFSGSPANRRHNINVGANTLNGIIIKSGEEFSLIGALGEIDGSTGYKQELVIKDNRTIPEYGGGLCQIGTTMFRAALGTGLPVTARRNHSYRVSYYGPAGTDATIYSPWPDLKFINDTGNNILIQSRIEGDNLYFDFWGTSDSRVATRTAPVIYNIARPGAAKLIETLDLKPGQKKCTERAHNGADAYFDYTVIYASGETKEKRFSSHYVPWQEVCLIGVEKLTEEVKVEENKNPGENIPGEKTISPETIVN
jgi:vancomycin resistance protein YoaR